MMDVGEDAFATASLPASEGVKSASSTQEQTAPAIPLVEAPMYPDMSKNGPPTPFAMRRFSSTMAYLLLLANALYFIYLGVTSVGGEPVILGLINSFSSAWIRCASVSSMSVLGLGILTKRDFLTRGAFLFLAICCCFAPYAESLSNRPTVTDNASVLNNVMGFTSQTDSAFSNPYIGLVSQGNMSNFSLTWCQDGGANRHVTPDLSDFTEHYRPAKIPITVAKAGVMMEAIGIGDCCIHTLDNMGRPHKIILRDVLHVPTANKHLMSGSCMAMQGYQVIHPCPNAQFPPGLYLPATKLPCDAQPSFIPLQTV
jgi:hypothetical protein